MDFDKDYYAVLGILPSAEDVVIRAAYKALAQQYHPDRYAGDQGYAHRMMAEINEAYGVLSDPIKRREYDAREHHQSPTNAEPKSDFNTHPNQSQPKPANSIDVPNGIKGWSWGAFLLTFFWSIGNRVWIGLLSIVPVIGLFVGLYLGFKGREMAWRSKEWVDIQHFNSTQRKWSIAAIVLLPAFIGWCASKAIPAYQSYVEKARSQVAMQEQVANQEAVKTEQLDSAILPDEQYNIKPFIKTGNPLISYGGRYVVSGKLMHGAFDDCCFNGESQKARYYWLALDQKFDMYLGVYAGGEYMYNIDRVSLSNYDNISKFEVGDKYEVKCASIEFGATGHYPLPAHCVVEEITKADNERPLWASSGFIKRACMEETNNTDMKDREQYCQCIEYNAERLTSSSDEWIFMRAFSSKRSASIHPVMQKIEQNCGPMYFIKNDEPDANRGISSNLNHNEVQKTADGKANYLAGNPDSITAQNLAIKHGCINPDITVVESAVEYISAYDINCFDQSIIRIRCKIDGCTLTETLRPGVGRMIGTPGKGFIANKELGDACTYNKECVGANTICLNRVCINSSEFRDNNSAYSKKLGESCLGLRDCEETLNCVGNICK